MICMFFATDWLRFPFFLVFFDPWIHNNRLKKSSFLWRTSNFLSNSLSHPSWAIYIGSRSYQRACETLERLAKLLKQGKHLLSALRGLQVFFYKLITLHFGFLKWTSCVFGLCDLLMFYFTNTRLIDTRLWSSLSVRLVSLDVSDRSG